MGLDSIESWRDREMRLRGQNARKEAALVLLAEYENHGTLAARIRFATMYGTEMGLSHEDVDRIVDEADAAVAPDDVEGHWELYRAYELLLGTCPPIEMPSRAFRHLVSAATHGSSPHDAFAVANHFHHGSAAVPPDESMARHWYKIAEDRGHPDAKDAYGRL